MAQQHQLGLAIVGCGVIGRELKDDIGAGVTRAFMNRMAPTGETRLTQHRRFLTPMVVSGTHSLDMSMWIMGEAAKRMIELRLPVGPADLMAGLEA